MSAKLYFWLRSCLSPKAGNVCLGSFHTNSATHGRDPFRFCSKLQDLFIYLRNRHMPSYRPFWHLWKKLQALENLALCLNHPTLKGHHLFIISHICKENDQRKEILIGHFQWYFIFFVNFVEIFANFSRF